MKSLPIDSILGELKDHLRHNNAVVLQASPGAGKTTRVPPALLNESWLAEKSIIMLQPRRIAARHAAEFMASERNEKIGQTIGYSIRFEHKRSKQTRIEVVTEGILTRRLQTDPELSGVGLVIFDEFHERSIHSDLALALCRDVQSALREDLKILVMSATLNTEPVATLLGNCPIVTSAGHSFEITTRYLPQQGGVNIVQSTIAGVQAALSETDGDILAFLPGAKEINQCYTSLSRNLILDIRPLYGALPFSSQRLALVPGSRRRVVLATNIAETSLTIEGISTVVDCGWERRPRYDSRTGISVLELKRISAASATQRRGRAGRLGPGTCYRLWGQGQQAELLPHPPAEIRVSDLAPLLLELASWGEIDPERLIWLDPPSPSQIKAARELLVHLGAISGKGQITPLGQRMNRLPLTPRLAKLVITAHDLGLGSLGCDLAALLSERDLLADDVPTSSGSCDLEHRWTHFNHNTKTRSHQSLQRTANDLRRILNLTTASVWPQHGEKIQRILAQAWPDRIAHQREPDSDRYLLSDGSGATLSKQSMLQRPPFLVALQVRDRQGQNEITLASTVHESVLKQIFKDKLVPQRRVWWDDTTGKMTAKELVNFMALPLAEKPVKATLDEQTEAAITAVLSIGLQSLNWTPAAQQLRARVELCRRYFPDQEWPDFSNAGLTANLIKWLGPFLSGITTRSALYQVDLYVPLQAYLRWDLQQKLEQAAPERITVPSGSRIRIDYVGSEQPILAVKLQELFGLKDTPTILEGRASLLIHALSPAGRPLAITQDLKYFWNQIYPDICKGMRGRYPKHPWPQDPWNAQASAKTKKQLLRK